LIINSVKLKKSANDWKTKEFARALYWGILRRKA